MPSLKKSYFLNYGEICTNVETMNHRSKSWKYSVKIRVTLPLLITDILFDSVMSLILQSLTPRCQRQWCWDRLRGVKDNPEADSTVSKTMLRLTPRCQRQCRVWLRGVKDNAWHHRVSCTCEYLHEIKRFQTNQYSNIVNML